MNKNVIESLMIVNNHLIIPNYFIKYYKKFDLENNELLMLIYLLNCNEKLILDNKKISKDLYLEENEVLNIISSLIEKNYISIEMSKNNGIIEEYISLDLFYEKIKIQGITCKKIWILTEFKKICRIRHIFIVLGCKRYYN